MGAPETLEDEPEVALELTGRSMMSGGGARRQPRPSKNVARKKITIVVAGRSQCDFAKVREHLAQNCLLVQTNQRSRTILLPHSEQKFGR
jgi:hypothetical protein